MIIDKVVIAGNGPSLAEIDYTKLPIEFDIFRCNQFYFEDKYYLGNKVKKVFFRPSIFFEQYFTIRQIIERGEYSIGEIVFAGNDSVDKEVHGNILKYAVDVVDGYSTYISNIKEFDVYKNFNSLYYGRYISMGVYMCAVAVACGYKEIYLAGIDFYDASTATYAFTSKDKNINRLIGGVDKAKKAYQNANNFHNINTDLEALDFLIRTYGVKIFTLSSNSVSSKYFSLSENSGGIHYKIDKKQESAIRDILIPDKDAYKRLRGEYLNNFKEKIKKSLRFFCSK